MNSFDGTDCIFDGAVLIFDGAACGKNETVCVRDGIGNCFCAADAEFSAVDYLIWCAECLFERNGGIF